MFSKKKMIKSTTDYWASIQKLKNTIENADAIMIGAGAGLSMSAGLEYNGKRFFDNFSDFADKYGLQDMYSAGFYPFETSEEYWAYWSRHIMLNRYQEDIGKPYTDLLALVKDKDYFILTTNVDHCFQKAGFEKHQLFYTQGDYGLWQCSKACHQKTYDNEKQVRKMVVEQKNMKIPDNLVPYCPHCGAPMTMNLRIDEAFVQDEGWYLASNRYNDFLKRYENSKVLYLELGVGGNTPSIIKYPFWNMTLKNKNAVYVCINYQEAFSPPQVEKQSICIQEDIGKAIQNLLFSDDTTR